MSFFANTKTYTITMTIPETLMQDFEHAASAYGTTPAGIIQRFLRLGLMTVKAERVAPDGVGLHIYDLEEDEYLDLTLSENPPIDPGESE